MTSAPVGVVEEHRGGCTLEAHGLHERRKRPGEIAKVLLVTVLVLAMVTGLGTIWLYRHLNNNINVLDVSQLLTDQPTKIDVAGPQSRSTSS